MHLAANRPSHLDLPSAARNALAAVLAAFLLGSALSGNVLAQDTESKPSGIPEKELNGYTVRWGTTTTSFFPRRVIEKHGLEPRGRGVLSVVVLKDQGDQSTPKPVEAEMSAHATNRLGQRRDIVMRPVTEDGLTSYIGTFAVNDQEQLTFEVRVRPQGWEEPRRVEFQRRFILD